MREHFDFSHAPKYTKVDPTTKKPIEITARPIKKGKTLTTIANGIVETTKTASSDGMIVTNPTGEEYILENDNFNKSYTHLDGDRYQSKAIPRPMLQVNENITLPFAHRFAHVRNSSCRLT